MNSRNLFNARKISQVENDLHKAQNRVKSQDLSPYINCRLKPFSNHGSLGIPDDSNRKRVVVDHHSYCDMKIDDTLVTVRIAPTAPYSAFVNLQNAANFSCTGPMPNLNGGITGFTNASPQTLWTPILGYPEYQDAMPLQAYSMPYGQTYQRLVGMGWRITYTGTALNAQGSVTVNSVPIGIEYAGLNNVAIPQYNSDGTSAGTSFAANSVNMMRVDWPRASVAMTNDTVVRRPESNINGIIKHVTSTYLEVPAYDAPLVLVHSGTAVAGTMNTVLTRGIQGFPGNNLGIFWMDPSFAATDIVFQGATGTYKLEVVACVEYYPIANSAMSTMAKDPPKKDPFAIAVVESTLKTAPVAESGLIPKVTVAAKDTMAGLMADPVAAVMALAPGSSTKFTPKASATAAKRPPPPRKAPAKPASKPKGK